LKVFTLIAKKMNGPQDKHFDEQSSGWKMFSTSKAEIKEMLVSNGDFTIEPDYIIIDNYPFQPSLAYKHKKLLANEIITIDLKATPPTIRIADELIFVSAEKKEQLATFVAVNNIVTVERVDIWDWILEPFLDTEYSEQTHKRLTTLLESYGLTEDKVSEIREEVKTQMLKYNFDTMLWEWVHLGALDVLSAMRTKYNAEQFADFYKRVLEIALLPDKQSTLPINKNRN
jgi:hypothetical protein